MIQDHALGESIAEVSRQLGVPAPTLRSWERRYRIPHWDRATGARRRYSAEDLHSVRLMRDQIARGQRASVAAHAVRELLGQSGPHTVFVADILAAAADSDATAIGEQLSQAQAVLGLGPCVDDVLLPAMQQVGLWWQTGQCDVEQETLTTTAIRSWLTALLDRAPPPTHPMPILLACGPGDLHTVGLESFAVLLRYQLRACHVLGAATPTLTLPAAIDRTGAVAVIIVSHLNSVRQRAIESLHSANRPGVTLFYAGNAFSSARSRRNLPGAYLGAKLQAACNRVDIELGAGSRTACSHGEVVGCCRSRR